MIHSTLVVTQTVFIMLVNDHSSTYTHDLVILALFGTILIVLPWSVINIFYSFWVLFVITYNYHDIWRQTKLIHHSQNEICSISKSECLLAEAKYTFSIINLLAMFYYIVPIVLSIVTYSAKLNITSASTKKLGKKVHFIMETGKSYSFDDVVNTLYDERDFEREGNILKILTSKSFQNIIIGQHKPNAKDPVSILSYENTRGVQIYYINNYSIDNNSSKTKQTFVYTSSGIRWIPGAI